MRESNVERASRISALLLSLPADEHGARDLAACLHRADGVLHGGGAWYARLDECVIADGARIEGPRLRVRCGVCREWMWTLLAEPHRNKVTGAKMAACKGSARYTWKDST